MTFDMQAKIDEIQELAFEAAAHCTMGEMCEACGVSHPTMKALVEGRAKPCFSTVARVHKGLRKLVKENENN